MRAVTQFGVLDIPSYWRFMTTTVTRFFYPTAPLLQLPGCVVVLVGTFIPAFPLRAYRAARPTGVYLHWFSSALDYGCDNAPTPTTTPSGLHTVGWIRFNAVPAQACGRRSGFHNAFKPYAFATPLAVVYPTCSWFTWMPTVTYGWQRRTARANLV